MQKSTLYSCIHIGLKVFLVCVVIIVSLAIATIATYTINWFIPLSLEQIDWIAFAIFIACICGVIYYAD